MPNLQCTAFPLSVSLTFPSLLQNVGQKNESFVYSTIEVVPGLLKIFDEILVNVADNHHRQLGSSRQTRRLDITIDRESGRICMRNDGATIDAVYHPKAEMYCPELVFGNFQAGSNFNDTEQRITGGRNGIGAKATNVLSTRFEVEIGDALNGKLYKQTWHNSMEHKDNPEISNYTGEEFTSVSFIPDYEYFGVPGLDDSHFELFCRRVYDIAACCEGLHVTLNGKPLRVNTFLGYVEERYKDNAPELSSDVDDDDDEEEEQRFFYTEVEDNQAQLLWRVGVALGSPQDGLDLSFVNAINTYEHGAHFSVIQKQIIAGIKERLGRRYPIPDSFIKDRLRVFVCSLIFNPAFNGQCKARLTQPTTHQLGNIISLPAEFVDEVCSSSITEQIIADYISRTAPSESTGIRKRSLGAKLEDAHKAGTDEGHKCTLIITEGDSAKSLAVAGLSVKNDHGIGREYFGVLPLTGKVTNVSKNANNSKILKDLENIMGLSQDLTYETQDELNTLRYGSVALMCDQDPDGSHIKGLVINFFNNFWPHLLRTSNTSANIDRSSAFLKQIVTPLVKVTPNNKRNIGNARSFFNLAEYRAWEQEVGDDVRLYTVKYYKGLGSSTGQEGREYFAQFYGERPLLISFAPFQEEDQSALHTAFTAPASQRKTWLNSSLDSIPALDTSSGTVTTKDFVNTDLATYFKYSNERAIPSVIDGLKPSQRKVLYTCFKRDLDKKEIKVSQLSGGVAELTCYHHGEVSLQEAIIKLAQDYTGSGNNVPLLQPIGQFGTRLEGGSDHASARYISTKLNPLARKLFRVEDDELLEYHMEEGRAIEPTYFMPIIPLVLLNGALGIGTGWSVCIPSYDPVAVVALVKQVMTDAALREKITNTRLERCQSAKSIAQLEGQKSVLQVSLRAAREEEDTVLVKSILEQLRVLRASEKEHSSLFAHSENSLWPWFHGHLNPSCKDYITEGILEPISDSVCRITELPAGLSTEATRVWLEARIRRGVVRSYISNCTDTEIDFLVYFEPSRAACGMTALQKYLKKKIQFHACLHSTSYDSIESYYGPEEVVMAFYEHRYALYEKRKVRLEESLAAEIKRKQKFVDFCLPFANGVSKLGDGTEAIASVCNLTEEEVEVFLSKVTLKQVQTVATRQKELVNLQENLEEVIKTTPSDMWVSDLDSFVEAYKKLHGFSACEIADRMEESQWTASHL